jgi:hypothetical protein
MSDNMWINYVKQYQASHPKLSYKECMERAKKPYHDLKNKQQKNKQQKRGGSSGIDLESPQLRFEAGVTALNSNLAGIGRPVIF